jgi:hypothetical protein
MITTELGIVDRLMTTYPILKKKELVVKILKSLNQHDCTKWQDVRECTTVVSPSTIIGMYLQEAIYEQRITPEGV